MKTVQWKRSSEKTSFGRIVETKWTAKVGKTLLAVSNYPGSRSLSWEISLPATGWKIGSDVDRYEYTVASLKAKAIKRALVINSQLS